VIPQGRPPLNTPAGCFMSNTAGAVFGMVAIAVGIIIGDAIGGFEGARLGLIIAGILAFFTPWRRWVLGRVRRWQQQRALRELGLTENDVPPSKET
jgi:hypothetical protein